MKKCGFTLIEMVVVLVVLAAVAHLGVRELGRIRDQRLAKNADQQLDQLRSAAIAFLEDTGRSVPLTNGTLMALCQCPRGIRDFAILPAARTNLFTGASAQLVDDRVFVPVGWRGPYMRLPLGKTRLMDPWGNEFLTQDYDEARLPRITSADGIHATTAAHFGPTSQAQDRRSVSLLPDRGLTASLKVKVVSVGGTTAMPTDVTYRWYGPAGNVITGAVTTVSVGAYAIFDNLTPGVRIIHDSVTDSAREVRIAAGDVNLVEIKVP